MAVWTTNDELGSSEAKTPTLLQPERKRLQHEGLGLQTRMSALRSLRDRITMWSQACLPKL